MIREIMLLKPVLVIQNPKQTASLKSLRIFDAPPGIRGVDLKQTLLFTDQQIMDI